MTQLQTMLLAELRAYMRAELLTDIAELSELRTHLQKLADEKPVRPANEGILE